MHHYIYPSKDTYITNRPDWNVKNFGVDEILQIGSQNKPARVLSQTTDYVYTDMIFNSQGVNLFTGTFSGSFGGTIAFANGTISGSNLDFSASYFSGSINGVSQTGSGVVSGSLVNLYIAGAITAPYVIGLFIGQLTGSDACFTGTGSGIDTRNQPQWTTTNAQYIDRSLLKFDMDAIFASIVDGTILNPQFHVKLKACNEIDLPITYKIYALPISRSWNMGDGYLSDGGSDTGVSWVYRDNNEGTEWYAPTNTGTRHSIDYISNPALATASFGYGGGTWYTSTVCSQSFQYQSSDIDMDVTTIVNSWLNGSIPNEGLLLVSSDELQPTGSGFTLKFFSRDTNTIYSPYLDVMWSEVSHSGYITGSQSTSSVVITLMSSGISASIQSGSSLYIAGGVSGSFSGSAVITMAPNYITASGQIFVYTPGDVQANNVWYANNGYHYDSWNTAWQLDPNHGGFLPNTDIQSTTAPQLGSPPVREFKGSFTGSFSGTASYVDGTLSGSGDFVVSYLSGSVEGTSSIFSGSVSSSLVDGYISGSASSANQLGLFTGQLSSSIIYLNGTGSGTYLDSTFNYFSGFMDSMGLAGNIKGIPVFGPVQGLVTQDEFLVTGPCGKSFSASLAKGIFTNGIFSGSSFTAYYVDHKFENAQLTGSWNGAALLGAIVTIPLPSVFAPYAYAYVKGTYVSGKALGLYTTSGSTSASFAGQFVDGNLIGGVLNLQLSGSVTTASYYYTSSVEISSSVFTALDSTRPFTIVLQNVNPIYKAGDIARIGVFGRKQFPLKTFGKSTQQVQYIVPEYLPTSSFYALKDNETDEIVMNFDSYTQIGCSYPEGNYFVIDTTCLPQDRYYRVLIRVEDAQSTYTIDCGKTFKVTR